MYSKYIKPKGLETDYSRPTSSSFPETMATSPMAIGTRGTVGSLVRREIEYFKRLNVEREGTKPNSTTATSLGLGLGRLLSMSWRPNKKKRRSDHHNGSFLPSMCSVVEIREGISNTKSTFDGAPGFSYSSLRQANHHL